MISNNNIKNILSSILTKSKNETDSQYNDLNTNMNKGWISSGTIEDIDGSKVNEGTPVGSIIALMTKNIPANYLLCDGSTYNIEDYTELANFFLSEFGSINYFGGDGTTTFAVPNLTDGRFLKGSTTAGTTEAAGLPNITGTLGGYLHGYNWSTGSGAFKGTCTSDNVQGHSSYSGSWIVNPTFDASRSSSIYGNSTTVTPSNISVLYCIKYRTTSNLSINMYDSCHYSEDEEVIGQWIDGKPLYRKVYEITSPSESSTSGQALFSVKDLNIETPVNITGYLNYNTSSNAWLKNNHIAIGTNATISAQFTLYLRDTTTTSSNDPYLYSVTYGSGYTSKPMKIILEYTKSTDTAFSVDEDIAWTALDSEVEEVINAIGE